MASWQSRAGTEDWTDWTSGGTSGRAEDMAEGEGKNRGNRKSTGRRTIGKGWVDDRLCRKLCQDSEGDIRRTNMMTCR